MAKIPVIILSYAHPQRTEECLRSLSKSSNANDIQAVVVDAQPKNNWGAKLNQQYGTWLTYLPLEKNLGFSGGNNVGIQWSLENLKPKYLVLLNDDTTVDSDAVKNLIKSLEKRPKAGAVSAKIYFTKNKEFHKGYADKEKGKVLWYAGGVIDWTEVFGFHRGVDEVDRGQFETAEKTEFVTGCCVAFRAKALQEAKGFDEKYFLYLEDLDLSEKLLQNNWQLWYEPSAKVWHDNAGSSGSGSKTHQYYFTRNRYLFGFRYAPLRTKAFLLKHLAVQWRQGDQLTRRAITDFLRGNYGKHELA